MPDAADRLYEAPATRIFLLLDGSQSLQQTIHATNGQALNITPAKINSAAAGFLVSYLNASFTSKQYEIGFVQFGSDPNDQILSQPPRPSNDPTVENFFDKSLPPLNFTEFSQAFIATLSWLRSDTPTIYVLFTDGRSNPSPAYGANRGLSATALQAKDKNALKSLFKDTLAPQNAYVYVLIQPSETGDDDNESVDDIVTYWKGLLADTHVNGDVKKLSEDYSSYTDLYAKILGLLTHSQFDWTPYNSFADQHVVISPNVESARFVFFRQDPNTDIRLFNPDGIEQSPGAKSISGQYAVIFDIQNPQSGNWQVKATNNVQLYLYRTYPQAQILNPTARVLELQQPLIVLARTKSQLLGTSPIWDATLNGPDAAWAFTITRTEGIGASNDTFTYTATLDPSLLSAEGRYTLTLTSRTNRERAAVTYSFCAHPVPRLLDINTKQSIAVGSRADVTISIAAESLNKDPGLIPRFAILQDDHQVDAGVLEGLLTETNPETYSAKVALGVGSYRVIASWPSGQTSDGLSYAQIEKEIPLSVFARGPAQVGTLQVSSLQLEVGQSLQITVPVEGFSALQKPSVVVTATSTDKHVIYTNTLSQQEGSSLFTNTLVLTQSGVYAISAQLIGFTGLTGEQMVTDSSNTVNVFVNRPLPFLGLDLGQALLIVMVLGSLSALFILVVARRRRADKKAYDTLQKQITDQIKQFNELQVQLERRKKDLATSQSEVTKSNSELANKEKSIAGLQKDLAGLKRENTDLQAQLSERLTDYRELKIDLDTIETKYTDLKSQFDAINLIDERDKALVQSKSLAQGKEIIAAIKVCEEFLSHADTQAETITEHVKDAAQPVVRYLVEDLSGNEIEQRQRIYSLARDEKGIIGMQGLARYLLLDRWRDNADQAIEEIYGLLNAGVSQSFLNRIAYTEAPDATSTQQAICRLLIAFGCFFQLSRHKISEDLVGSIVQMRDAFHEAAELSARAKDGYEMWDDLLHLAEQSQGNSFPVFPADLPRAGHNLTN